MIKVFEAHFGAKNERPKMRKAMDYLMENSVSFAVHDDRGGTGCFTVTVEEGEVSHHRVPHYTHDNERRARVRRWLSRNGFRQRDAASTMGI